MYSDDHFFACDIFERKIQSLFWSKAEEMLRHLINRIEHDQDWYLEKLMRI